MESVRAHGRLIRSWPSIQTGSQGRLCLGLPTIISADLHQSRVINRSNTLDGNSPRCEPVEGSLPASTWHEL